MNVFKMSPKIQEIVMSLLRYSAGRPLQTGGPEQLKERDP